MTRTTAILIALLAVAIGVYLFATSETPESVPATAAEAPATSEEGTATQ